MILAGDMFGRLPEDVVLNILFKLEEDPRYWGRLACVSVKFLSLIRDICWKNKCSNTIPSVVADLLFSTSDPPGGWGSLHKLAVCCPGLLHAGVLLENSDFGLERELGPDENYLKFGSTEASDATSKPCENLEPSALAAPDSSWSLYDDLYLDTVYNELEEKNAMKIEETTENSLPRVSQEAPISKRRKVCRSLRSHLASGVWNLSREQGNKLLHSRFRGDCLYICDWPGCVHIEEKRNYMLFRGIFKNFKGSHVWRTIKDGNRSKIDLNCAFCSCKETWDLHSAFCLRRVFGYHDDGEPVVRAYVCENGHVSGAWTDFPLYT